MTIFEIIRNQIDILQQENNNLSDQQAVELLGTEANLETLIMLCRLQLRIATDQINSEVIIALENYKIALRNRIEADTRTVHAQIQRNGHILLNDEQDSQTFFGKYIHNLEQKWNDNQAIETLIAECSTIFSYFPVRTASQDKLGLVIGQVQSGKTSCFNGLISAGIDYGFNTIIILSGKIESLRKQTQDRLEEDIIQLNNRTRVLTALSVPENPGLIRQIPNNVFGGLNNNNRPVVYGVFLKNARVLSNLINFINSASDPLKRNINALIIDDECDEATPNLALPGQTPSPINNRIRELKRILNNCCYIGFTATPFANILNEAEPGTLYPKDFMHFLPTPAKYFGPEQLFGDPERSEEEINNIEPIDVIRLLDSIDVQSLTPQRGQTFNPQRCQGLLDALAWFICASAVRLNNGDQGFSTMLIHTSSRISHQRPIFNLLNELIEEFRNNPIELRNLCQQVWNKENKIIDVDIFSRAFPNYNSEIRPMPEWEDINKYLETVINTLVVKIDNSESQDHERIKFDRTAAPIQIAVGGNKLSRGLTLEGLVCSLFARNAASYDSLLQMGRWFGFRRGYELLPRIWTTPRLRDGFLDLVTMEKELRREILEKYRFRTPAEIGVKIIRRPGFAITRKAAMRNARQVDMEFAGSTPQTINFTNDEDILCNNWNAAISLLESLRDSDCPYERSNNDNNSNIIIREVPYFQIYQFLESYIDSPDSLRFRKGPILEFLSRFQDNYASWTVVMASKNSSLIKEPTAFGEVGLINRSRLKADRTDDGSAQKEKLNIKALMSSTDILIDQPGLAQGITDRSRLWEIRSQRNLPPVLILYPINKNSEPLLHLPNSRESERVNLLAKEHIMGVAIIFNPSDTDGVRPTGEWVSLPPNFGFDMDDEDSELSEE